MSKIGNKDVMAKNLVYYVGRSRKTQKELSEIVGVAPSTFNDWMKGKVYPRIDKIEILAGIFGILKSDLIEDRAEMEKNNDAMVDIIVRMRGDSEFLYLVQKLNELDSSKIAGVRQMLDALLK
jgi:transcriptional regulator with XRE-family HTH domain